MPVIFFSRVDPSDPPISAACCGVPRACRQKAAFIRQAPNSRASQWRVRHGCLTSRKVSHTTIGITALHCQKGLLHDDPIQTPIQCRWGFTQGATGIWPAICEPTPNVLFAGRFTRSCALLFDPRVCSFAPGANMRRTIAAQYIL